MKRKTLLTLSLLLVAGLGTAAATLLLHAKPGPIASLRTVNVTRGSVTAAISATGTIEPEEVVDVGAQVGGQISSFGNDKDGKPVDYGSVVEQGTVLAQIDDSLYRADAETAAGQLAQARAAQVRAEADLLQLKAKLDQAQRDWERAQKLGPSEALAPTTFDSYKTGYEAAQANVAVGEAAITQAKAAVAQSQATLTRAQQNLAYCTIRSPVRGVIIDRRVNIGQTVVSSLNAPSLFLIAKDLKRLQVWVSVNEADIGHVVQGQPVTFTVDAYAGRLFQGKVNKTRLNAAMTQNVVTYTVEVTTDNSDGTLLPYLTANTQFETGRRDNVLLVPNTALRWMPRPDLLGPAARSRTAKAGSSAAPDVSGSTSVTTVTAGTPSTPGTLWVERDGAVQPLPVKVGLSDGSSTEVEGELLHEGLPVVIGDQATATAGTASASGGASPFAPQLSGRPRNGNAGAAR
jgi:HlyD family secretion protein